MMTTERRTIWVPVLSQEDVQSVIEPLIQWENDADRVEMTACVNSALQWLYVNNSHYNAQRELEKVSREYYSRANKYFDKVRNTLSYATNELFIVSAALNAAQKKEKQFTSSQYARVVLPFLHMINTEKTREQIMVELSAAESLTEMGDNANKAVNYVRDLELKLVYADDGSDVPDDK